MSGVIFDDVFKTVTVSSPSISTCVDVTLSSLANNQVLIYNNILGKWRNYSLQGSPLSFNEATKIITVLSPSLTSCTDVVLTAPSTNNILQYDGLKWVNVSSLPQSYITGLVGALASKIASLER